jgi:membrane-associated phospholipid phosphatase
MPDPTDSNIPAPQAEGAPAAPVPAPVAAAVDAVATVSPAAAQVTQQAAQQATQATQQAAQVTQQAAHQVQAKIEQVGQTATVSPRRAIYQGRRFAVGYAILVMMAAFLSALAKRNHTLPGDVRISRMIQRGQEDKAFDILMHAVSEMGWQWPSVITRLTFSTLMWAAGFRMEGAFTAATWSGDMLTMAVKETVGRPRPSKDLVRVIHTLGENSFPSGHVVHYVTFYGWLFYIFFIHLRHGKWRNATLSLLAILVVLIGPSRVYMGEHWPSDVGGAYLVGSLWLAVEIVAYLEMKSRFQMNRHWPLLTRRAEVIK